MRSEHGSRSPKHAATPAARPPGVWHVRNRYFLVLDGVGLLLAVTLAYVARFEDLSWLVDGQRAVFGWFLALAVPGRLVLYWRLGLYRRVWSLASVAELERVLAAGLIGGALTVVLGTMLFPWSGLTVERLPISVAVLEALLACGAITAPRVAVRFLRRRHERRHVEERLPRAIIVGAGAAGQMAARELLAQPKVGFRPVAFVDDAPAKRDLVLGDLPVMGTIADIPAIAHRLGVSHIVIAMPSAPGTVIRSVVQLARAAGLETRTVPSLHQLITRNEAVSALREVRIEDLLKRAPIETDVGGVRALVEGQTVLVTGAGGSIGSELCRQLASLRPARIVLLGRGENSIFEIQQELRTGFPTLKTVPVVLDVRDRDAMADVVITYQPAVIFHAAAHKHVPLMEENVLEALRNNVLGTQSVVDAALAAKVPQLVLISTDKAVRPKSVMGASKRIAEQIVQVAARESGLAYVSVRFGNVLGSRGSVVPTFLRQIRAGGPVLVTDAEMRRYFMTIPEAAQLVLQAFVLGSGGEVFCLDMGEPVRIVDLARDLIQLSGLEPDRDIAIEFTGTRPGEKLYEELFFGSEQATPTDHPKVLRSRETPVHPEMEMRLSALVHDLVRDLARGADEPVLRAAIAALVEDFSSPVDPFARSDVGTRVAPMRVALPFRSMELGPTSPRTSVNSGTA